MEVIVVLALLVALPIWIVGSLIGGAARRARIKEKYGDTPLAHRIIDRTVWVGQSAGQLVDSLGRPVDIDQKVLKTKSKEIWKYRQKGKYRFGLRITVENGAVVGWDEKL